MEQKTINQRIAKLVEHFAKGNKSAFAKNVGISNQSLGEIVGTRQSAPSFAALQKIALAYPSVSLHWLVLGEGPMFELTDKDQASKLERYVDDAEHQAAQQYALGLSENAPSIVKASPRDLWELRAQEEIARASLVDAIEWERNFTPRQYARVVKARGGDESKAVQIAPNNPQQALMLAEKEYLDAVRNRIRAERATIGFSTDSTTAIYRLGDKDEWDSLYGGILSNRLSISDEAAENLVKSGKIRATYIEGEGYRITEQAVRVFLGEF